MGNTSSSPEIVLNESRRPQLEAKLSEYNGRVDPYRAPEAQVWLLYKIHVLTALLENSVVRTWDLSRQVAEEFGGINGQAWENACGVIADYNSTGGENCLNGTGLPQVEQLQSA